MPSSYQNRREENGRWEPSKLQCYECKGYGHFRRNCPEGGRKKYPEAKKVNRVCVEVGTNAISTRDVEEHLPEVKVNVGGKKIDAILDSGSQICVFRKTDIPDKYVESSGSIYLVPALGKMEKADLVQIPISLWEEGQTIRPEIKVTAAVTANLNCSALITPSVHNMLLHQAARYQVNAMEKGENEIEEEIAGNDQELVTLIVDPKEPARELQVEESIEGGVQHEIEQEEVNSETEDKGWEFSSTSKMFRKQQRSCSELARCWDEAREAKNHYFIEDGLLYHKTEFAGQHIHQLVIPACRRSEILQLAHNAVTAGHLAANKTLERIKFSFHWEGLRKQVKRYCSACEECQLRRRKRVADRAPIQAIARPPLPSQVVNADLIGPIKPKSARGHSYVLCCVDQHSRWPEAVPIRSLSAKATCDAFLQIFMRTGIPQVIAMDNATNFTSKLTDEFLKQLGTVPRFSTPGYPQSNGLVERFNGTIKNMLHHAIRSRGKDWDRQLPFLLWACREIPNATTGVPPFQLLYGRLPSGPLAILKTCW